MSQRRAASASLRLPERPFVALETIRAVIAAARDFGAATAASRPTDSVRIDGEGGVSTALDRSKLWLVETPQAFRRQMLYDAHLATMRADREYTDDAAVVEAFGHPVHVVESAGLNPKITHADDLLFATERLRRDLATS
jgi:2-C-methyl-D-erythritol 4-phosphate cytidylyltransferase